MQLFSYKTKKCDILTQKVIFDLKKDEMKKKEHLPLNTVKRVDEVVRHPHLVTQDQFTQVSKKVSDIPEENFSINIELFR
jgi:hypothetical protein